MKRNTISLRRRHLMIAGIAGAAAPATLWATGVGEPLAGGLSAAGSAAGMVVSGRILGADGTPAFNATIELWPAGSPDHVVATTDGDGRFFAPVACARPGQVRYRVRHGGHETRAMNLAHRDSRRDEAGVWRATFGHTMA